MKVLVVPAKTQGPSHRRTWLGEKPSNSASQHERYGVWVHACAGTTQARAIYFFFV
jgi:hypothetical protein